MQLLFLAQNRCFSYPKVISSFPLSSHGLVPKGNFFFNWDFKRDFLDLWDSLKKTYDGHFEPGKSKKTRSVFIAQIPKKS
jgi:hypothetical protein